jgi:hypothetical protein
MSPRIQNSIWTFDEDERLRKLAASGKNFALISKLMNRTSSSVRNRVNQLKISVTGANGRLAYRPWTQEEDEKLRNLALAGECSRAIGIKLNRTEIAVRCRGKLLHLVVKRSTGYRPAEGETIAGDRPAE